MASSYTLTVLSLVLLLATLATHTQAKTPLAPAPAPVATINLTAILEKGAQFTTLMRLLDATQTGSQIENQVKSSTEGMTLFAPTDNAFQNLKPGTLNGLSAQEQVELIQYQVLPKFYTLDNFLTVSNPVRTQATGENGEPFGLNITSMGNNQVNVSSGMVVTQLNTALRDKFPLAVYQVDKVLLPQELFDPKVKAADAAKAKAKAPSSSPVSPGKVKSAKAEGPVANLKNGGVGVRGCMGFVLGATLVTIRLLY